MNLKKLTQAVFEGLPSEYRWAAVDANGKAWAFIKKPVCDDLMFCDGDDAKSENVGVFFDATDWQNSLIERQDVLTAADIDWSKAPEGATHYSKRFGEYYKAEDGFLLNYLADESRWIVLIDWSISALESPHFEMIKLPESIHDVARSIEAARVAERTYPHYFKDVSGVDQIDVYAVLRLFEVTDPCLQHIVKKALCAGKRGAKDWAKDVQEIADTAQRMIELESGK